MGKKLSQRVLLVLFVISSAFSGMAKGYTYENVSLKGATDAWSKGSIKFGTKAITVTAKNDMRMVTINTKKSISGKKTARFVELTITSNGFKPAWGKKVCGFAINKKSLDPVGITTEKDRDGWHWVLSDAFKGKTLMVHLPLDKFTGEKNAIISGISVYVAGNNTGSLAISNVRIVR